LSQAPTRVEPIGTLVKATDAYFVAPVLSTTENVRFVPSVKRLMEFAPVPDVNSDSDATQLAARAYVPTIHHEFFGDITRAGNGIVGDSPLLITVWYDDRSPVGPLDVPNFTDRPNLGVRPKP